MTELMKRLILWRLGAAFLAIVILSCHFPMAAKAKDSGWLSIAPGMEFRTTDKQISDTDTVVTLDVVRADPKQTRIVVLDTYSTVSDAGIKYADYSLIELKKIVNALAIINGGFTQSFTFPLPAGLVVENNVTTSPLNRISKTQSGIFCVNDDEIEILKKEDYQTGNCAQALQSGPRIVEYPGENGISARKSLYIRAVAGVDREGRVLLVRSSNATLFDLAEILRLSESEGGFDCQAALNLSGDSDAGLLWEINGDIRGVGQEDRIVPSAIAVLPLTSE